MKNKKREKKLAGRIKCHGTKYICSKTHSLPPLTKKGTKPKKKAKKNYV